MAQIKEIQLRSENLALDRIGTHPLECKFGIIRILCNFKHNWMNIIRSFSKLMIIDDLTNIIGIPITISGRVNDGGVHLEGNSKEIIYQPLLDEINTRQLMEDLYFLIEINEGKQYFDEEINQRLNHFINWILEYVKKCKDIGYKEIKKYNGSTVSNQSIMTRLICFSKKDSDLNQNLEEDGNVEKCLGNTSVLIDENFTRMNSPIFFEK